MAEFYGVGAIAYTVPANHFHVLVPILRKRDVSDKELLKRYRLRHPGQNKHRVAKFGACRGAVCQEYAELREGKPCG